MVQTGDSLVTKTLSEECGVDQELPTSVYTGILGNVQGNRDEYRLSRHRDGGEDSLSQDCVEFISYREARLSSSGHDGLNERRILYNGWYCA